MKIYLLFAVCSWKSSVYSSASYKVDLPCFFVRSMSLCFCTRSESDTRNAVTSHDCYTLVENVHLSVSGRAFLMPSVSAFPRRSFAVQSFICFFQSLCYFVIVSGLPMSGSSTRSDIQGLYRTDGCIHTWILLRRRHISVQPEEHGSHPGSFPMFRLLSYDGQEIQSRSQLLHSGLGM